MPRNARLFFSAVHQIYRFKWTTPILIIVLMLFTVPLSIVQHNQKIVPAIKIPVPTLPMYSSQPATLGEQTDTVTQPTKTPTQTVQTIDESQNHTVYVEVTLTPTQQPTQIQIGGVGTVTQTPTPTPTITVVSPTPEPTGPVTPSEQKQIDKWIQKNNLNQYGDPKGTAYAGGNPTFDMGSGAFIDRYEYIISQHPDKPWEK